MFEEELRDRWESGKEACPRLITSGSAERSPGE